MDVVIRTWLRVWFTVSSVPSSASLTPAPDPAGELHVDKRQRTSNPSEKSPRNRCAQNYISRHFAWCAWRSAFQYPHCDSISQERFWQLFCEVFPPNLEDSYCPRTPEHATATSNTKMSNLFPHLCSQNELLPLPARLPLPTFQARIKDPISISNYVTISKQEQKALGPYVRQNNGSWDPQMTKTLLIEFFNRTLVSCRAQVRCRYMTAPFY